MQCWNRQAVELQQWLWCHTVPWSPQGLITIILFHIEEITPLNFLWQHPWRLRGCFFSYAQPLTLTVKPGTKPPAAGSVRAVTFIFQTQPISRRAVTAAVAAVRRRIFRQTQTPAQCDAEHNRLYSTTRHKYRHFYNSRFLKKTFLVSAKAKCHIQNTEELQQKRSAWWRTWSHFHKTIMSLSATTHTFLQWSHTLQIAFFSGF